MDSERQYVTIARLDEVPSGASRAFEVEGRVIALFNDGTEVRAIDDACPHMGASLAEGPVEGDVVTCPWHGWRFNTRDGTWCDNPRVKIATYPVRIEGDKISVGLPRAENPS